jgi:hypothetical protein
MQDMQAMAQAFSKSALFGAKTTEQCLALLLLAQAEGQHPAIAMRDFDVIQNRPAKKAEAMLRSFLAAGGIVEWHEMGDTMADASFTHPQGSNGKPVRITWDMDRAKKAGLSGKDNWTKYSRQMLANRVISEGCRRVYPAATSGMYEPGEVRMISRQEKDMGKADIVEPQPDERAAGDVSPHGAVLPATHADAASAPTGNGKTRTDTLRELCELARANMIDLLAKAEVTHADALSESDWTSLTAMLGKRIKRLEG